MNIDELYAKKAHLFPEGDTCAYFYTVNLKRGYIYENEKNICSVACREHDDKYGSL